MTTTNQIELISLILTCLATDDAQTARELAATMGLPVAALRAVLGVLVADGCVVTSGLAGGTRYCLAVDEPWETGDCASDEPLDAVLVDGHRSHADLMTAWQTPAGQLPLDLLESAHAARAEYERAANGVGFQWGPIATAMEQSALGLEAIIAGRVSSSLPEGYILTPGMVQAHRDRAVDARGRATAQLAAAARDLATLPNAVIERAVEIVADVVDGTTYTVQVERQPAITGNLLADLEATAEGLIAGKTLGQLSARGVA